MITTTARKLFVNLPVRDLKRSIAFFTRLGFAFEPRFTDENGTCMILNGEAFVMLLAEGRFKDFTRKAICDASTHVEGLFAFEATSRAEVDAIVDEALAAGGTAAGDPVDYGFMYYRAFYDLDGHHWETIHMDMAGFDAMKAGASAEAPPLA